MSLGYSKRVLKHFLLLVLTSGLSMAEVHSLTLREAVDMALKESPDVVLARLDQQKAQAAIRIAKEPFAPKVYAGSGAAKVWGYPMGIEGAAPSIVQTRTDMALYNRPKQFEVARVRENARGAAISTEEKSDDVAYQTATQFLDVQEMARRLESLRLEMDSLQSAAASTNLRVQEGRELPIEAKRVALDQARARQRFDAMRDDLDYAEAALAVVLGYPADDRVLPVEQERPVAQVPESEQAARDLALQNSRAIRRLESDLQAKGFELREYQSVRWPIVDLVAQYALFAKSDYEGFFAKFQRNNGELGASIQVPVWPGSAAKGEIQQTQADILSLRTQVNQTRNRIELDTQKSYQELQKATSASEVARLDLDYAREQVSVLLAQLGEGRVQQQKVDEARFTEQEKWIAFYDAQHAVEKARLDLLHQTGTLLAAIH